MSKTLTWLSTKFSIKLNPSQHFIDQFNCGYWLSIVITGKIYITSNRICFYSAFNESNLFFQHTFVNLNKQDIKCVEKKKSLKIIDNALMIKDKYNNQYFFTSFVSRDQCYRKIQKMLKEDKIINKKSNKEQYQYKSKINHTINTTSYDQDCQFLSQKIKLQDFQYFVQSYLCKFTNSVNIEQNFLKGKIYLTNQRMFLYSLEQISQIQHIINIKLSQIQTIELKQQYKNQKIKKITIRSIISNNYVLSILQYNTDINIIYQRIFQVFKDKKQQQQFKFKFKEQNQSISNNNKMNNKMIKLNLQEQQDQQKQDTIYYSINQDYQQKQQIENNQISHNDLFSREIILNELIQLNNKILVIKQIIKTNKNINAIDLLKHIDVNCNFTSLQHKKYSSFEQYFKTQIIKRKKFKCSQWSSNPSSYFTHNNGLLSSCPYVFSRQLFQTIKLQQNMIPFMPKQSQCKQLQKLFIYCKNRYIIQSTVNNTGVPYADSFYIKCQQVVNSDEKYDGNQIKIQFFMEIVFIKQTMMKNVIKDNIQKQYKKLQEKRVKVMKEYVNHIDKLKYL